MSGNHADVEDVETYVAPLIFWHGSDDDHTHHQSEVPSKRTDGQ